LDAFSGGAAAAWLGAGLHLFIASSIAAVYCLASRRWRILLARPVACGVTYGALVYGVMNHIVVPLSRARPVPFQPAWFLANFLGHLFLVGLPVALIARWSSRRAGRRGWP
jgi:uncharacterized membrane protein YagU involved in acid resistance